MVLVFPFAVTTESGVKTSVAAPAEAPVRQYLSKLKDSMVGKASIVKIGGAVAEREREREGYFRERLWSVE